jgi:hypothetical protein
MKLYELTRGTRFTIEEDDSHVKYELDHIDGMYSICYCCFSGDTFHFSASMEVVPLQEYPLECCIKYD